MKARFNRQLLQRLSDCDRNESQGAVQASHSKCKQQILRWLAELAQQYRLCGHGIYYILFPGLTEDKRGWSQPQKGYWKRNLAEVIRACKRIVLKTEASLHRFCCGRPLRVQQTCLFVIEREQCRDSYQDYVGKFSQMMAEAHDIASGILLSQLTEKKGVWQRVCGPELQVNSAEHRYLYSVQSQQLCQGAFYCNIKTLQ